MNNSVLKLTDLRIDGLTDFIPHSTAIRHSSIRRFVNSDLHSRHSVSPLRFTRRAQQ